jgi:hypothetical protein
MKTGRLLKFHRPGADVQAYVYRDGNAYHAAVYVAVAGKGLAPREAESFSGVTEAGVESDVRAWVERNYPKDP